MKLEKFFEKFDQFADAPDAVAKMRELIMWSAFSGAFSSEERSLPMPEGWAAEGAPTLPAIPASWKWQRGSDVFDVIRGVSYKKSDASDIPVEGSFPLLRANNIGNGINFDELVYVPRENIRDEQFVRRGDILIAMSSGSKKLVGKAAPIVTEFKGAFGAFCGVIRNKSAIPDAVLARYFQTPQYTSWVTAAGRGIGINNLGKGDLDSLPIPTPPLPEQKRIVAKVDELMALCDRLEAQQQERETRHAALARASLARFADAPTPANLDFLFHKSYDIPPADLRKSILTLAVQGKLVPQDPNDEPATRLIERITSEKSSLVKGKMIRASHAHTTRDVDSVDGELPNGWMWVLVDEITSIGTGSTPLKSQRDYYVDGDVPWVTSSATNNEFIESPEQFVTQKAVRECNLRIYPKGSLLIALYGQGKTRGQVGQLMFDSTTNQACAVIEFFGSGESVRDYIRLFFLKKYDELREQAAGGAQPNLSGGMIRLTKVPLPPLAEQRRIVAKAEQLMALVDALETQLAASRTTAENLLSALVNELTTQD